MKLELFNHERFGEIRSLRQDNEPWFCATDICNSLDYKNPSRDISRHVDEEDRSTVLVEGGRSMVIVNESGLYSLVLRSNKPEAKEFKKWVTSEVLPQIRKTGTYAPTVELPDFNDPVAAARAWADTKEEQLRLTEEVKHLQPKADFYDAVTASETVCQLGVVCSMIAGLPGRNNLFAILRADGVLMSGGKRHNHPKSEYVKQGLFTVKESAWEHEDKSGVTFTPYVTQKGVDWLRRNYAQEAAA